MSGLSKQSGQFGSGNIVLPVLEHPDHPLLPQLEGNPQFLKYKIISNREKPFPRGVGPVGRSPAVNNQAIEKSDKHFVSAAFKACLILPFKNGRDLPWGDLHSPQGNHLRHFSIVKVQGIPQTP